MTQIDKLRAKQDKVTLLHTKKIRYVGIHKIVERAEPHTIYQKQGYFCSVEKRTRHRDVPRKLDNPATHEIHLASDTVTASIDALSQYNLPVAVTTSLMGSTRAIIGQRHGVGVYVFGEEGKEDVYFILTWKDVLRPPNVDPNILDDKRKRIEKNWYPKETFSREEDGRRVYYASKADDRTRTLVLEALHRTKADVVHTDAQGGDQEPVPES